MRGGAARGYLTAAAFVSALQTPIGVHAQQNGQTPSQRNPEPSSDNKPVGQSLAPLPSFLAPWAGFEPVSDAPQTKPEDGNADQTKPGGEQKTWYDRFIFDHITDWLLVIFTAILASKTTGLFRETAGLNESTRKLWEAGEAQRTLSEAIAARQAGEMQRSIAAASKSAEAAVKAAEVAERTLIASNRPWLKVNIRMGDQPLLVTSQQASASVAIFAQNTGNAPALHVSPHAWMLVWRTEPGMDPYTEHERRCKEVRDAAPTFAFTLFPDESFPAVAQSEMWMMGVNLPREALDAGMKAVQPSGLAMLLIGGCVDYGSTSSPGQRHQTQFLYDLRDVTGTLVSINREVTSHERLALRPMTNGYGNSAD
jgi:hypothetical protein